jgi:tetratricopeptide (TPR) repeat protein
LAEIQAGNHDDAQRIFESLAARRLAEFERHSTEARIETSRSDDELRKFVQLELQASKSAQDGLRFDKAVQILTEGLMKVPRDKFPIQWAELEFYLGNARQVLGIAGDPKRSLDVLEQAVLSYKVALEIRTEEALPKEWGATLNNLGSAYLRLGERLSGLEGQQQIAQAVQAHTRSLEVRTKGSVPEDWAATQHNLGADYEALGMRCVSTTMRHGAGEFKEYFPPRVAG